MRPFWPRSLLGQVLVSAALALLVAQGISAALALRAGAQMREEGLLNGAAFRFVATYEGAHTPAVAAQDEPPRRFRDRQRGNRRWGIVRTATLPAMFARRGNDAAADRLRAILIEQDLPVAAVRTATSARRITFGDRRDERPVPPRVRRERARVERWFYAAVRLSDERDWAIARIPVEPRSSGALPAILLQTAIIYLVLVGGLALLLRRATRPLARLTHRVERFGRTVPAEPPLAPEGPEDVARLIEAHNGMEQRIAALLDEKDVMLGAIGHDLKTPLTALRVRIEGVPDGAQRARMVEGIEDITRSLDDILSLARIGRAGSPPEAVRLDALVGAIVEEYEDMERPVTLAHAVRVTARIHETWLRRALRNLIENALRYGGTAQVFLLREGDAVVLRVEDAGPGIPEGRIAAMLEPFQRGETSRNRTTGGAGLGLTIARAIAEDHGGTLTLANRESGGLRAEIRLALEGGPA